MDTAGAEADTPHFDLDDAAEPPLARLRAWLRTLLADLHPDFGLDVLLVCTELATNALEHAEGPRVLRLSRRGDCVLVEVDDSSPDALPVLGSSRLGPYRGSGLVMVESLCRWGVRGDGPRKTVWAELSTP